MKNNYFYCIKRLIVFLTIFLAFPVFAISGEKQVADMESNRINLEVSNLSLFDLFKQLESLTDFSFFYDSNIINDQQKISLNVNESSLKEVLKTISSRTGLDFKQINRTINVTRTVTNLNIQQREIKGSVSSNDGIPLIGVTVQVKDTNIGTITDFDGRFEIEIPSENAVLIFSYLGYEALEVLVDKQTEIDVIMQEDSEQLSEVVVTALGIKREEKALGYSVQKITGENVQAVKGVDVATSLTGKVAGLWIQNSTEFNEAPDIRLRGGTSNPLLVIDGVPYGNMSLNEVPSEDISSIDVLKGATASALYGSRGSGGAVIITTKKEGNGLSINSNNMFFAGYLALPEVQHSYSAGLGGTYSATDYVWGDKLDIGTVYNQWNPETKQYEDMPLTSRGKDNFKQFLEPGMISNNNINFAHTGEKGSIRSSLTHIYNKGQYPNLELNRLNMNVSGEIKFSERLDLQSSLGYNRSMTPQTTGAGYGDQGYIYQILMWTGPEYDLSKYRDYWVTPNEEQNWHYSAWYDNPYLIAYEKLNSQERNITDVNLTSNYRPFKGAKVTARLGYDFYSNENTRRNPPGINSTRGFHVRGLYSQNQTRGYSLNTDVLLNYEKSDLFKGFDIDFTVGGSLYKYEDQGLSASTRNGINVPGIYSLNNSNERPNVSTFRSRKQVNSLLGLASFSYDDTFFVDVTGRNDWSSTLPEASRSYFYPSASGSILLNELINKPSWMDLWKIRGSWTLSKQDLSIYETNINYSIGQGVWNELNTAAYPSTIKTSEVDPETSRTWEIGTAAYLFGKRLTFDLAYYNIYTYNRQVSSPVPASSGFTSALINIDETRDRRGIELTLGADLIKKDNFNWNTSFNFSKTHAYYKELDAVYSPDNLWIEEGGRIDNYVIRDWLRDPNGNIIHNEGGTPLRSEYNSLLGHSDPDFIWGFTNMLDYKNFKFQISFDGRVGGYLYNYTAYKMWDTGAHPDSDNQWRYDEVVNGENNYIGNGVQVASGSVSYDRYGRITEDTRTFQTNDTPTSYETYARTFADGRFGATDPTFIKLREIAIGYDFPKETIHNWGFNRASISLTAQNVFLWTKEFKFADPDWNSDSDLSSPSQRFVGVNIKLETLRNK